MRMHSKLNEVNEERNFNCEVLRGLLEGEEGGGGGCSRTSDAKCITSYQTVSCNIFIRGFLWDQRAVYLSRSHQG
jgi:hypothetical protein